MKKLNKFLIIPFFVPLLVILFISFFNIKKTINLKVLVWQYNEASLGLLMAAGSSVTALLTMISYLTLVSNNSNLRRKVVLDTNTNYKDKNIDISQELEAEYVLNETFDETVFINRKPGDSPPTISVPYRIIQKDQEELDLDYHEKEIDSFDPKKETRRKDIHPKETHSNNEDWLSRNSEEW